MPDIAYLSETSTGQRPKMCKHLTLDSGESFCTEITVDSSNAADIPDETISTHIDNLFSHLKTDLLPAIEVLEPSTKWRSPWTVNGWVDCNKVVEELSKWWIFRAQRSIAAAAAEVVSPNTQ